MDIKKTKKNNKGGGKVGRPTDYTPELADLICERIATHPIGLQRLCNMYDDLPQKITIRRWRKKHPEFSAQYAQAKIEQVEWLVDEILEIADDTSQDNIVNEFGDTLCNSEHIARSRLRIDTRKWLASKLVPRVYGNKLQHDANITTSMSYEDALKELE